MKPPKTPEEILHSFQAQDIDSVSGEYIYLESQVIKAIEEYAGQFRKPENKSNKFNSISFKAGLILLGVDSVIADEWMQVRKRLKAINTETAFNRVKSQIEKSGLHANECIKLAVEKSWRGFEADWIKNNKISFNYDKAPEQVKFTPQGPRVQ